MPTSIRWQFFFTPDRVPRSASDCLRRPINNRLMTNETVLRSEKCDGRYRAKRNIFISITPRNVKPFQRHTLRKCMYYDLSIGSIGWQTNRKKSLIKILNFSVNKKRNCKEISLESLWVYNHGFNVFERRRRFLLRFGNKRPTKNVLSVWLLFMLITLA